MWKYFIYTIFLLKCSTAFIAYDCGHERMNQTRISLLNVERCDIKQDNISHETEEIQLLELNEVTAIHVYQCKINVLQSVYYCGMFSHLSLVPGGLSTFIMDITQEECLKIQKFGIYQLKNNKVLSDIKTNSSSRHTEIVAGTVDSNGYCSGTSYMYGPNSWNNVIVIHAMQFTITDYNTTLRLEDNQVELRNNIYCDYMKGKCVDPEYGMSFWNLIPDMSCEAVAYSVLYEGNATKVQSLSLAETKNRIIYTVNTGEVTFALEVVKHVSICQYTGYQTEHPRLMIVLKNSGHYQFKNRSIHSKNLNLFTYINSKFVYVERHIRSQIQTLYTHLIQKKCELEREVLETQLAVAHHHPSEFALIRMKEPGYTAVSRGEIIYLIKCQAVEVTIRRTERCFNELPVTYKNKSYFMTPTTHLLHEYGTEIPCSPTLIPAYLIHGTWYGFSPHSHRLEYPESLKPSKEIPWKYEDIHDLIKSGIYSPESTEELRRQIMYPAERKAIENVLTRALAGHDIDQQNINIMHLFSSQQLSQFTSRLQSVWLLFTGFGNIYAGILGIWIILRIFKYLLSVILNLKIIKTTHGTNWWLLAAMCTVFTHYIVYRRNNQTSKEQDVELTSVSTHSTPQNPNQELTSTTIDNPVANSDTLDMETLHRQTKIYPTLQQA